MPYGNIEAICTDDIYCLEGYGNRDQGSAYVFEKFDIMMLTPPYLLPWQQVQKLIANDGYKYDHFGFRVATYLDKIIVGSPCDNVHICEFDPDNFICVDSFEGKKTRFRIGDTNL